MEEVGRHLCSSWRPAESLHLEKPLLMKIIIIRIEDTNYKEKWQHLLRLIIVTAWKKRDLIFGPADRQRSVSVLQQARELGRKPLQVSLRHHQRGKLRGHCKDDKIWHHQRSKLRGHCKDGKIWHHQRGKLWGHCTEDKIWFHRRG